jgi:hypothetical protein
MLAQIPLSLASLVRFIQETADEFANSKTSWDLHAFLDKYNVVNGHTPPMTKEGFFMFPAGTPSKYMLLFRLVAQFKAEYREIAPQIRKVQASKEGSDYRGLELRNVLAREKIARAVSEMVSSALVKEESVQLQIAKTLFLEDF